MKQRAVARSADYLSHRPMGRVVRVKRTGEDDYLAAVWLARWSPHEHRRREGRPGPTETRYAPRIRLICDACRRLLRTRSSGTFPSSE